MKKSIVTVISLSVLIFGGLSAYYDWQAGLNIYWFYIFAVSAVVSLLMPLGIIGISAEKSLKSFEKHWGKLVKTANRKSHLSSVIAITHTLLIVVLGWFVLASVYLLAIALSRIVKSTLNAKHDELKSQA